MCNPTNCSDAAIEALARCQALEALVLAVCNSVTVGGLAALGCLSRLRTLDLSYTPLEVRWMVDVVAGDFLLAG